MEGISYISRELIKSALEAHTQSADDIDEAMRLCTSFCRDTFGLAGCVTNKLEISTFCASTIYIATKRDFQDKILGGTRKFDIVRDLVNVLTSACIESAPVRTITTLRAPEKHQMHHQFDILPFTEENTGSLLSKRFTSEHTGRELMSVMTPFEKELIYALDGELNVFRVCGLGFRRREAEVIIERIHRKVAAMEYLFYDLMDPYHVSTTEGKQTRAQIKRDFEEVD